MKSLYITGAETGTILKARVPTPGLTLFSPVSPCRPLHLIRFHGVLAPNARLTAHRDHLCKVEVVAKSGSTTVPKSPITEANSKAGGLRGAVRLYSVYRQVTYGAYRCSSQSVCFSTVPGSLPAPTIGHCAR